MAIRRVTGAVSPSELIFADANALGATYDGSGTTIERGETFTLPAGGSTAVSNGALRLEALKGDCTITNNGNSTLTNASGVDGTIVMRSGASDFPAFVRNSSMGSMSTPAREDFTGTTNGTIGSSANLNSATFPAGHIIKSGLLSYHVNGSTSISTTSTSFVDTGITGSLTTLKSSADSRLEFHLYVGMQQYQTSTQGSATITLTAASNTSYVSGNDILYSPVSKNNNGLVGGSTTLNQSKIYCFHYDTSQTSPNAYPSNLTSYSAGDTLYVRVFIKKGGTNTYFFYVNDSHITLHYYEIKK